MLFAAPGAACENADALYALESAKLLENAPTFRHAWEDRQIQLSFTNFKRTENGCTATMTLKLPQQDLDEVNADLNANPAKRILLAAQGYAVPEQAINQVEYHYQINQQQQVNQEVNQLVNQPGNNQLTPLNAENHALTHLHNNVQYLYQNLAQQRIALKKGIKNEVPWSDAAKQKELSSCKTHYIVTVGNLDFACTCRVDNLSRIVSPRQMELVHYIESQPYAAATGALNSYQHTSKAINEDCNQLIKKAG